MSPKRSLNDQRGFLLLDLLVACTLIAMLAFVFSTILGLHPTRTHDAALAFESAMAEARALAGANATANDPLHPSGATVVVEALSAEPGYSRIAVFRSRPIILTGRAPYAPAPDLGFPPRRVRGSFAFGAVGGNAIHEPFAIMLSGSGYASIAALAGPYDVTRPQTFTSDPGCPADGAQITVGDGAATESHPFGCSGGHFAAN